jgi:lysozyme
VTTHRELAARLICDGEGLRLRVYDDATGNPVVAGYTMVGHPTIGYGRNLAGKGISEGEADAMLAEDLVDAEEIARGFVGGHVWRALSDARLAVLVDMAHNLGASRLYGFVRLRAAIMRQDWPAAGREIEDSAYFRQTKKRGVRNRDIMRSGHIETAGIPSEEWSE